ncbi:hypothetical protein SORBI_3003G098401, partial [Sorghum bicolor]
ETKRWFVSCRKRWVGGVHAAAAVMKSYRIKGIILGIPTISLVDANCGPDLADISISTNDDTMTSIKVLKDLIGWAITYGSLGYPKIK